MGKEDEVGHVRNPEDEGPVRRAVKKVEAELVQVAERIVPKADKPTK